MFRTRFGLPFAAFETVAALCSSRGQFTDDVSPLKIRLLAILRNLKGGGILDLTMIAHVSEDVLLRFKREFISFYRDTLQALPETPKELRKLVDTSQKK